MREEEYWILLSKKITGEATTEELELLKKMTDSNFEWKKIMENLQELWNSKSVISDENLLQENEDSYLLHINRLKKKIPDFKEKNLMAENIEEIYSMKTKKPFYKKWITYAGIAAVVAGIIFLYPVINEKEQDTKTAQVKPVNEIAINSGSRTKIQLPDGSQVWVNSGSKLTYEGRFDGSTREVQLEGEAYFDVVKDAAHPFIVHTSGIDIKVLGTTFNVKAYTVDRTIEATLIHGSIEVLNHNQPGAPNIILKPHEKLVYNKYQPADIKGKQAIVKPANTPFSISIETLRKNIADSNIVETAWVYNKLIFEEERFEDLALKMERWYNVKINIENEKLKNYKMSGSFVNETAEEAIKILQFLVPFKYSLKNNEIKIMKK
jgi:transmembrane sensor